MDVEIGIQNMGRTVSFTTDKTAEEIVEAINTAVESGQNANIVDSKGRHILIPGKTLGYAIVGSETSHPVGFGALG
ncbi:MAG: DUF3107 domain-containing protein [Bifidobacteriaceae bacterium]|jgi:hypothetical protein|nr:DUF3107 domain-containing protein [Bifidobacteriaceae bacterium]MCI1978647.1 DUF3107 domain-containing protein [Bifidobacteriaceae bacterium]